jgi:hypothetical protein
MCMGLHPPTHPPTTFPFPQRPQDQCTTPVSTLSPRVGCARARRSPLPGAASCAVGVSHVRPAPCRRSPLTGHSTTSPCSPATCLPRAIGRREGQNETVRTHAAACVMTASRTRCTCPQILLMRDVSRQHVQQGPWGHLLRGGVHQVSCRHRVIPGSHRLQAQPHLICAHPLLSAAPAPLLWKGAACHRHRDGPRAVVPRSQQQSPRPPVLLQHVHTSIP